MVLYCEVGEATHGKTIAASCWSEICSAQASDAPAGTAEHLRSVHSLRFLRDAFRARPECLGFASELAHYINGRVQPEADVLEAKIALEATGLVPEHEVESILIGAFRVGNSWVSETAFHACRHLKRVGPELRFRLFGYMQCIGVREFTRRHREVTFSLSLSDAFRDLRRYCILRWLDSRLLLIGVVVSVIAAPLMTLLYVGMVLMLHFMLQPSPSRWFVIRFTLRIYAVLLWLRILTHSTVLTGRVSDAVMVPGLVFVQHLSSHVVTALVCLIALALVPFADLSVLLLRWRRLVTRQVLEAICYFTVFVLVGFIVVHLAPNVFKALLAWLEGHRWILVVPPSVLGLGFLWIVMARLAWLRSDKRRLREVTRGTALTRALIAGDFAEFRTRLCRLWYVEWLRDTQVQPQGPWPNKRPNLRNDEASTLLAQLDERWLGLDT